jgi:predicted TIM-barrel fold metal-dependent hydrolase
MNAPFQIPRVDAMENLELADQRVIRERKLDLPAGTIVVSADSHISIADDIFRERAPKALRDRMPRVWKDEETEIVYFGEKPPIAAPLDFLRSMERPGIYDMAARRRDNRADGVEIEVAFPQALLALVHHPDFEAKEWVLQIYNEWLSELQTANPGFYGVGIAHWWDGAKSRRSIERIKELGLKTFMIPISPGKNLDGQVINYSDEGSDPIFATAEEAGLPLSFHIGEAFQANGRAGIGAGVLAAFAPFRRNFGELVFGGVFDRHPGLKVLFAEAQINWIPGMLQDAEMTVDTHRQLMAAPIQRRPTEYWLEHCHATFISDAFGLRNLDLMGAQTALWSSDYPHNEGSHGFSADIIQSVVDLLPPDEARMVLGGNALRLFDLPTDRRL